MRGALPAIGDDIIAAIRESVPEYAQPLEGAFGHNVRTGVSAALERFVDDIESPGADPERWRLVYFNLGRGELRQGRTLEALLAAYRVGARVSWRRIAEAATESGAGAAELTALAEAIFAYIDEISAISAEGYAAEQAEAAGESQRRRAAVVALLLDGAPREAVVQAAAAARWELPETAAAIVARDPQPAALGSRMGQGVLAALLDDGPDSSGDLACAIVPDADSTGRRREVEGALRGRRAGIGPAVEPALLPVSLERARRALELVEGGVVAGEHAWANEHLAELVVHGDPALLADLARQALAPLADETPRSRERLLETLRAWVDHPGRPTEVARTVHVHPQTARYRLRRLRELLGDIDDPARRFELALALRGAGAGSAG